MASSSLIHVKRYHVFPSFHGPDVRRGFLSYLHNLFTRKGITTFKDQEIERGHTIGPELVQAIRESRVSVVLLSKNYASSSWCLDELVEIIKCKEDSKQIVMTIFYEVDPSDVRKQRGDFGSTFEETCKGRTEEEKQRWIQALAYVATIAGEHSLNWVDEAAMAEKFVTDVSNKLNVTLSKDFDNMVGLQAHLRKVSTLLCLESDEVKMIGIWGPAGIGKSTIARALHNLLSSEFRLSCFMGNLSGSFKSIMGVDHYDSKLSLQNQFLSKLLNQGDMRVSHLGAIKEWLQDQRVLIILDDVDDLEKLETLASELSWFGDGSRIIVTTEDKQILKIHGINDIYHVGFPPEEEALEIVCLSAFKQRFVQDGFEELANKVVEFCGYLPLGLRVVGSSLHGESKLEWELQLSRMETSLDRKIEDVLRVGYDRLSKKDQSFFLHIACMFNDETVDHVTTMLADSNLDVEYGLKTLIGKSLVEIVTHIICDLRFENYLKLNWGRKDYSEHKPLIGMHILLQQLGRQVVSEQSDEPGKRQFLVDADEILNVLANETGTGSVIGILLDISTKGELYEMFYISGRAFEGMRNLRFLRIFTGIFKTSRLQICGDMTYLPRLSMLDWVGYPEKRLPLTFRPDCLIELYMEFSSLEKLWEGIQPLPNLKTIVLSHSDNLKEIPNLSKATNLETLTLWGCESLVELPSSIRNLHKLKWLRMMYCKSLRVIPTNINLASLERVDMSGCSRLRTFPDISTNIKYLDVKRTKIEDVPASVVGRWSRLDKLLMGSGSLKRLTYVPGCVTLDLSNSDIKRIPNCVVGLPHLVTLSVIDCTKLVSITGLPPSLESLKASNCVSLKTVCCSFLKPTMELMFPNCLKLDEESRRIITQQPVHAFRCLPGEEIPAEFTRKATGNSITIPLASISERIISASSRFKACLLLPPNTESNVLVITCRLITNEGVEINSIRKVSHGYTSIVPFLSKHLLILGGDLFHQDDKCQQEDQSINEILFEFGTNGSNNEKIIECGVHILREEAESSSRTNEVDYTETRGNNNHHTDGNAYRVSQIENIKSSKHTSSWSWLKNLAQRKK